MPDQVRHDDFETFYEFIIINCHEKHEDFFFIFAFFVFFVVKKAGFHPLQADAAIIAWPREIPPSLAGTRLCVIT